jgi:hypothetical protein
MRRRFLRLEGGVRRWHLSTASMSSSARRRTAALSGASMALTPPPPCGRGPAEASVANASAASQCACPPKCKAHTA